MELNICHIYPDLLNLYGDNGNILCLKHRLESRDIKTNVIEVKMGDKFDPDSADLIFIGGGQDFEQNLLINDLKGNKEKAIIDAIEQEKTMLAVCAGFQMLGKYYKGTDSSQIDYIGALDCYTQGSNTRMIGNYSFVINDDITVVGFENHSGKTYLGKGLNPLGVVKTGFGNNGEDGFEGAVYKNTYCTYSHGPVLPKNPQFADILIKSALEKKYGEIELKALDDTFENAAHKYVLDNYIKN